MGGECEDGNCAGDVGQEVEKFGRCAAVSYEEECVTLSRDVSLNELCCGADGNMRKKKTYVSHIPQIPMRRFARMHEARRDAQRFARRHQFLPDVGRFAHAGDDEFAAVSLALRDSFDGLGEVLPRGCVCSVEFCYGG